MSDMTTVMFIVPPKVNITHLHRKEKPYNDNQLPLDQHHVKHTTSQVQGETTGMQHRDIHGNQIDSRHHQYCQAVDGTTMTTMVMRTV